MAKLLKTETTEIIFTTKTEKSPVVFVKCHHDLDFVTKMKRPSLRDFRIQKSLKLGCPFKLLQKVKPDWQLAADLTDFMFMNPPSIMSIYMGVAKWRYLKIIAFSNTKKKVLKVRVQSTRSSVAKPLKFSGLVFSG